MSVEELEVADPAKTPKEEAKEVKPTLEDVAKQNKELNEKLDKVLKQNADKDSFISKVTSENKTLRDTLQKVSTSIEGKPKEQRDAILEAHAKKLSDKGYDAEAVSALLEVIADVADKKANERLVPLIMESAQELIESDPDIDQDFLQKNSEDITAEYNSYKVEVSPRKIKQNLKKAYAIVKNRRVEEAKKKESPAEEKKREEMVAGASAAPKGKREEPKDDILDRIEKAGGAKNSHFI